MNPVEISEKLDAQVEQTRSEMRSRDMTKEKAFDIIDNPASTTEELRSVIEFFATLADYWYLKAQAQASYGYI